jgi:uncharacterized membrane protein YdjX (TVP38/TMEM64 family)
VTSGLQEPAAPPSAPGATRPFWSRWALAAVLVAAILAFYVLGLPRYLSWDYLRENLDVLLLQVQEHLLLALLLFFLLYTAVTALSLPAATVLTLAAGALFGRWLGTGVVSLASTLGATLAFLASRYLFRDWVQRRFGARLETINRGVEQDGAFYLFTIRLVPLFPFFLVNLGMGLTRMRLRTFVWVSWLGMLPGTFLYVNAGRELGRIDSPGEVLSLSVIVSLALLGIVPLLLRWGLRWRDRFRLRTAGFVLAGLLLAGLVALGGRHYLRYHVSPEMDVAVREFSNAEYPEDPADRSVRHGQYSGRRLHLVQKDDTHFDFILEPTNDHTATIAFRDIDVSLMTPAEPAWTHGDAGLERIALTDRQWNRQQVRFEPNSPHVKVSGGDGFEKANLFSAELAKNCLNAGLWEVLLFTKEDGNKALYYQNWFNFPLGHYAHLFERGTGLPYWRHWYYLEHWFDPAGTPVRLDGLRNVTREAEATVRFDPGEAILAAGEQVRKQRTVLAENLRRWQDFSEGPRVRFATFIPPGRYSVAQPWKNEFWRFARLDRAVWREIVSPATDRPLQELELIFEGKWGGERSRFLVSGFDAAALPQLVVTDYPQGMYMPMGIGVPTFFQSYEELQQAPPQQSPYFSLLLDADGRWINHHEVAIDGPVLHRDAADPRLLHVYLLSYERHSLVRHFVVTIPE